MLYRAVVWLLVGLVVVCSGCASVGNEFTVDTSLPDPVVYAPGTHPGHSLRIPLEGFEMACESATVKVTVRLDSDDKQIELAFPVTMRLWAGQSGLGRIAVAEIPQDVAVKLTRSSRGGLYGALVEALSKNPKFCGFTRPAGHAPELAARALQLALPRPYSAVLQSAYNYRVWPPEGGKSAYEVSIDMLPGMRLRVENSVPISPAGMNTKNQHPSSYAAPAFISFHALTGRELCDPRSMVSNSSATHICMKDNSQWERETYLSAADGLARLGLRQHEDHQISGVDADRAYPTSGLLDLLERADTGDGAWRYWRLWIPVHRNTNFTKRLEDKPVGGSHEESTDTPLLIAAGDLRDLNNLDYKFDTPCKNIPSTVRCHSLRYRAVPVPEFVLYVNGELKWVPVGTTLADLLAPQLQDGFAPRAYFLSGEKDATDIADPMPFSAAASRRVLAGVTARRMLEGGRQAVVASSVTSDEAVQRFLRLQLVPGDEVTW